MGQPSSGYGPTDTLEAAFQALHAVFTAQQRPFEWKMTEALRLGCEATGFSGGHLLECVEGEPGVLFSHPPAPTLPDTLPPALLAHLVVQKEPVVVPNLAQSPWASEGGLFPPTCAVAGVGVYIEDTPAGLLCFTDDTLSRLAPGPRTYLSMLAECIASEWRRHRLEHRLRETVDAYARKNETLERFTYTVSHDLKAPLFTIQGFLGLLEEDLAAGNEEGIREALDRIKGATDVMYHQIHSLLTLARLGKAQQDPVTFPLGDVARRACDQVSGQLRDRNVSLHLAPDMPPAYADPARILEVFQNLLENAIKFLGDQPAPRIEIGATREEGKVRCFVRDNGIGIAPRHQEAIFQLFHRLDDRVPGTGIGLALVKRILETAGGKVGVESEGAGMGSTFWFTLPLPPI